MNKSRIRRLEKRVMPDPDTEPRYLTVMKSFSKENYWCRDLPGRFFPSKEKVIEAWEAEHGKLPLGCGAMVLVDFSELPLMREI